MKKQSKRKSIEKKKINYHFIACGFILALALFILTSKVTGFVSFPSAPGSPTLPSAGDDIVVSLTSPTSSQILTTNQVTLAYTFSASSKLDKCTLFINGIENTSHTQLGASTDSFSLGIKNGNYTWMVGCFSAGNARNSSISNLNVAAISCVNSCSISQQKTCSANGYQICGDYNNDGCLELSTIVSCQTSQQCISGGCVDLCTAADWSSSISPLVCPQSGKQTKTWTKIGSCTGGVSHGATEEITCNYQAPTCSEFTYSNWGECTSSGTQTRTVQTSSPANCQGGTAVTTRSCTYIPPCLETNWQSSLSPAECTKTGKQTKTWTKIGSCTGGVSHGATEEITCNYQAPTCSEFTYSNWGACQIGNIETRSVLSSSPSECQGGTAVTTRSCTYIPPCVSGQTVLCDLITNGKVDGYKKICQNGNWIEQNTCKTSCNTGFVLDVDRCAPAPNNKKSNFTFGIENNVLLLRDDNSGKPILEVLGNNAEVSSKENVTIQRSTIGDLREYVIVNNLKLDAGQTKTVYLEKKNQSSNAVCFIDSEVNNISDILNNCVQLQCPGNSGKYSCEIENNVYSISGLSNSGVIEDTISCGDNVCSASVESCNTCSIDCGICDVQTTDKSKSGGSGGGASSGKTTQNNNQATTTQTNPVNEQPSAPTEQTTSGESSQDNVANVSAKTTTQTRAILIIALVLVILISGTILVIRNLKKHEEAPQVSAPVEHVEEKTDEKKVLEVMISDAKAHINAKEIEKARSTYEEIKARYALLENKDLQLHDEIIELYYLLASFS